MSFIQNIARPTTALALAVSVALSPLAASEARAASEEALIAGAIGTIILGAIATQAIGSGNLRVQSGSQTHYNTPPRPQPTYGHHHGGRRDDHRGTHNGHRGGRQAQAKQPPAYCKVRYFDRASGQTRTAYDGACLRRSGYVAARR